MMVKIVEDKSKRIICQHCWLELEYKPTDIVKKLQQVGYRGHREWKIVELIECPNCRKFVRIGDGN